MFDLVMVFYTLCQTEDNENIKRCYLFKNPQQK